jgi:hypothetical protein
MSLRAQSTIRAPRRRRPVVPEKAEQAQGVALLRSLGAWVGVLGTRRPGGDYQGTCQTPGFPDVYAIIPRRGAGGAETAVWWEVKSERGRLRPEQDDFRRRCFNAGHAHVTGGLSALMAWLVAAGFLKREQLPASRLGGVP